jgi:RND family efflux transporter MFP subunit
MSRAVWTPFMLLICIAFVGCKPNQPTSTESLPKVDVSEPVPESVAKYEVFTGRTQAKSYADLRARVTGYLKEANFEEGEDVEKDKVLFLIDPDPYVAVLNQAKANLDLQKAQLIYNDQDYQRNVAAFAKGAVSKDDLDKAYAALETSKAAKKAADAAVLTAQINVDYTKIRAPFSGRISRRLVDPGNDVQADVTVMVNLVQMDPMYAYFDVDERTFLRIREFLPEGKVPVVPNGADEKLPVTLGFANEAPENFSHPGTLRFGDNKVDPTTGTLRMWGEFKNPKRDLFSGLFIRVRMGIPLDLAEANKWRFVSEAALGSDQGRKYLYVVKEETKDDGKTHHVVDRIDVEVGPRQNGLIAVKGLQGDERVVVSNLQRIRPKTEVAVPEMPVPMPRATTPATTVPAKVAQGSK